MDAHKSHEDAARGRRALAEFEQVSAALDTLEREYTRAMVATGALDDAGRARLWQAVHVVRKVRDHLESTIRNGKFAEAQIAEIARMGERRKLLGIV